MEREERSVGPGAIETKFEIYWEVTPAKIDQVDDCLVPERKRIDNSDSKYAS